MPLSKAVRPTEWVLTEVLAAEPLASEISQFIEGWRESWVLEAEGSTAEETPSGDSSPALERTWSSALPAVAAIRECVERVHAQLLEQTPERQQSCTLEEVPEDLPPHV